MNEVSVRTKLLDHGDEKDDRCSYRDVRITLSDGFLQIHVDGYGEHEAEDGYGDVLLMEFYNGQLRLLYTNDINNPELTSISLEGAREALRHPD